MLMALTAAATPVGQGGAQDQVFPGERSIEVQGAQATFGGKLQEPVITPFSDAIAVEGADATFGTPLQDPYISVGAGCHPPRCFHSINQFHCI